MGEEHFAELLGRVDVEAAAGELEDSFADALEFNAEALGKTVENSGIDADADLLHAIENRRERQIDFGVDTFRLRTLELRARARERVAETAAAPQPAWPVADARDERQHRQGSAWCGSD